MSESEQTTTELAAELVECMNAVAEAYERMTAELLLHAEMQRRPGATGVAPGLRASHP